MQAQVTSVTATPMRLSRYRSVRRAAQKEECGAPPVPEIPQDSGAPEVETRRAPSRYRRPSKPTAHNVTSPASNGVKIPSPVQQQVISEVEVDLPKTSDLPKRCSEEQYNSRVLAHSTNRYHRPAPPLQYPDAITSRQRGKTIATPGTVQTIIPKSYEEARFEARIILENEQLRLRRLKEQQESVERVRRLKEEAETAIATNSAQIPPPPPEPVTESQEHQRKVSRAARWVIGRSSQNTSQSQVSQKPDHTVVNEIQASVSPEGERRNQHPVSKANASISQQVPVELASKGYTPIHHSDNGPINQETAIESSLRPGSSVANHQATQFRNPFKAADVPVSAINAGERRVELRLGSIIITLPVSPSTTARDMLNSASVVMSQPIDPRSFVLVEVYGPLNLERPLRQYEHIRDVMNSWDSDGQNFLDIVPESECNAMGLAQQEPPSRQPQVTAVNLYHSQRPGKWEKKLVTVRSDGQVTVSKDEHDRNTRTIFHLSDFDIYTPAARQVKRMKAPKKICFAVKSQQRSVVFEDTTNFVHFFATNDSTIADRWYRAVQSWRSWYLVNVLIGPAKPPSLDLVVSSLNNMPRAESPSTTRSVDTIPYQLGTFKPLMDFSTDMFKYGDEASESNSSLGKILHHQHLSTSGRHTPSFDSSRTPLIDGIRNQGSELAFNSSNLNDGMSVAKHGRLGRHISIKKVQSTASTDEAFTGRGLLAQRMGMKECGDDTYRRSEDTNDAFTGGGLLGRSLTKKRSQAARPGQPLVNLAGHSEFVNGSLLHQVEAFDISHGSHLPVIDRSRGIEVMDKTGEF